MTVLISILAFAFVGYIVFLIPFAEAPELSLSIIAGLLAVVIVLGITILERISFVCKNYDKTSECVQNKNNGSREE